MTTQTLTLPRLNGDLWDHQAGAFQRAADTPGFGLGHDMGTGKGATAVALLEHDQAMRVLVLCPKNVIGVWPAQLNGPLEAPAPAEGFSPRHWHTWSGRVMGARGPKRNPSVAERATAMLRANTDAIKLGQPHCAVVNYEASHLGAMRELILGTDWDALICDESHRAKLPSGKASRLAADVAARVRARGGRVLCLTGTPMPHSPLDIWAQMRILDGGERLGTNYRRFCVRFGDAEQIYAAGGVQRTVYKGIREDRLERFTEIVGEAWDFVDADDVLDLPDTLPPRYVSFDLSPAARRAYDELEAHGITEARGGTLTAANAMVLVLRLAQATSGFGTDVDTGRHVALEEGHPDKAKALADVLEDVAPREPVVVFCRFHADLDAVREVAESQGRRYGELSGRRRDGLTADDPPRMSPDIDVLGCQLKSGGVGIDLTRSRIAVYYSLDFTLADYAQSRRRLVRPGQHHGVLFIHLLARDTVDYAVLGALRNRQEVIDQVITYMKEGTP